MVSNYQLTTKFYIKLSVHHRVLQTRTSKRGNAFIRFMALKNDMKMDIEKLQRICEDLKNERLAATTMIEELKQKNIEANKTIDELRLHISSLIRLEGYRSGSKDVVDVSDQLVSKANHCSSGNDGTCTPGDRDTTIQPRTREDDDSAFKIVKTPRVECDKHKEPLHSGAHASGTSDELMSGVVIEIPDVAANVSNVGENRMNIIVKSPMPCKTIKQNQTNLAEELLAKSSKHICMYVAGASLSIYGTSELMSGPGHFIKTTGSSPSAARDIIEIPDSDDEAKPVVPAANVPNMGENQMHKRKRNHMGEEARPSTRLEKFNGLNDKIMLLNLRKEILAFVPKEENNCVVDTIDDCSDVLVVTDSMAVACSSQRGRKRSFSWPYIMLLNLRKEILAFVPKEENNCVVDTIDDCSDILVVSDSMAVAAHNEDANVALVGHTYVSVI